MKGKSKPMTNEEIAATFANHENRLKVSEHRIDDLEDAQKQIYDLTISVKELAMSVKNMVEEQKEQSVRLKKLESKPAKKWETVGDTFLTAIVGTIAGALMAGVIALMALGL
jgi:TolA-binding protein